MSKTSDNTCFQKAQERDDETFTLVGQDRTAPHIVCEWIKKNIETCPAAKLREALECAIKMREADIRKSAD